jgi:outer membrane protein
MKNKLLLALFACMLIVGGGLRAQSFKIGYTNADAILSALPDAKKIETELKTYQTQIQTELQNKQKEFQTKLEAYQKIDRANTLPSVLQEKEGELQRLQQAYQDFVEKSERDMQSKQAALLEPVYKKIQDMIDEVAKSEGYDYVISSDAGGLPILLYAKEEYDITNKVITKLGGTPIPTEKK